jgi:hypothetical protein
MTNYLLTKLSDVVVSIRGFALTDNPFKHINAVNRIRAFGSQGSIIIKADDADNYASAASIAALVSKIAATMLGISMPTFVDFFLLIIQVYSHQ